MSAKAPIPGSHSSFNQHLICLVYCFVPHTVYESLQRRRNKEVMPLLTLRNNRGGEAECGIRRNGGKGLSSLSSFSFTSEHCRKDLLSPLVRPSSMEIINLRYNLSNIIKSYMGV
ncbi:hypothetical protein Nepgr_009984 [Nepenthes gracilis]|uniref:Uncharacterized protein n=1 Tax=Nepenthes gracilis TaxID=150966 RepID=A0AAD3XKV8_NEPGR|nr:hypothetical protein Nepgr_009984 [Nepenthes gracilis]